MKRSNISLVVGHRIILSRFSPDTRYNCRVESKDEAGNLGASADLTFKTVR
jgi:hypothetical protein